MLNFPQFDPIAFSLGPLAVRWYGLMYMAGFLTCWGLMLWRTETLRDKWPRALIADLVFYAALGVIIGGRVGYVLIYQTADFLANPLILFKTWQGGMAFHGGLVGVLVSLWLFSRHSKKSYLEIMDFVAPYVPIGLFLGRIGNFINGELWGRPTEVAWAMIFPYADALPRHPSQLYEAFGEGVVLFALLWWYTCKPRPVGKTSAFFLIGYGCIRFLLEFTRQPDVQLGFIAFDQLTMGQLLCVPMILLGIVLLIRTRTSAPSATP